ncbi:anthranilate phosphoribosyltransferase [Candidatus Ishikawaella capsulata]|uniref:Anthranilate phosphoribosyltransferase n=1 Tax=Candidatus Ishikawaella capsulata Mpkobe TaxID=476281 RepID=C5WCA3_9ENTR|nr:bifunctional indole-3-glycerol-phosphate synthase/anthranilate phosphoribosyltransferase [Candidatus Ishikawaella capsulata Mpkobe]
MQSIMEKLYSFQSLTYIESQELFTSIINKEVNLIQITAILIAIKMRGESPEEIAGAASALLEKAQNFSRPDYNFADIVGTGGDGSNTINISTASAFVAAACGFKIAKHGNCNISSKSGSADLLQAFNINLNMSAEQSRIALDNLNICFLFTQKYHPIFQYVMPMRQQLKTRTLFNILGPLINPARPIMSLIGVYNRELTLPIAQTLKLLGYKRAIVVYGGGIDEVALHSLTHVTELNGDKIINYVISPEDFGLPFYPKNSLKGGTPKENFDIFTKLLQGKGNKAHESAVAINVAMLMKIFGKEDLYQNTKNALDVIRSGQAYERINELAARR